MKFYSNIIDSWSTKNNILVTAAKSQDVDTETEHSSIDMYAIELPTVSSVSRNLWKSMSHYSRTVYVNDNIRKDQDQ